MPKGDTVVIIRDQKLIDDFDPLELIFFAAIENHSRFVKFIEFEKYPKFRDSTYHALNF